MKYFKYIYCLLSTLFIFSCYNDDGYIQSHLYNIQFNTGDSLVMNINETRGVPFSIIKKSGKDNFYEFTIEETEEFKDYRVNGIAFAPNQYVRIDRFADDNTFTFTAIKAGEYRIPVKIRFCGEEMRYNVRVVVNLPDEPGEGEPGNNDPEVEPGLVLAVNQILKEANGTNSFIPSEGLFNVEDYKPILKFDGITLVDNEANQTWQLNITSKNNNIQKITYRGNDYAPGEYFDFDPAFASELSVVPKDEASLTFGEDKLIFNAKNNGGTTSNTVEKDIKFYKLDIAFSKTLTPDADGYYDMDAFYELIPTYYYPDNNKNQGVSVTRQVLKHNIGLHFEGKGVKLKSIVLKYLMTRANSSTTSNVTYEYTNVLDQEVYDIPENNSITLLRGGYSGTDMPTSEYTSTGVLTITTEFNDVYEFKFRITKSNMYIMWFNKANVFEGNIQCDANFGDPSCDPSQLLPLY